MKLGMKWLEGKEEVEEVILAVPTYVSKILTLKCQYCRYYILGREPLIHGRQNNTGITYIIAHDLSFTLIWQQSGLLFFVVHTRNM